MKTTTMNMRIKILLFIPAEGVGVEPTNRFLHGYGLANRWLTIRRTLPSAREVLYEVGQSPYSCTKSGFYQRYLNLTLWSGFVSFKGAREGVLIDLLEFIRYGENFSHSKVSKKAEIQLSDC